MELILHDLYDIGKPKPIRIKYDLSHHSSYHKLQLESTSGERRELREIDRFLSVLGLKMPF